MGWFDGRSSSSSNYYVRRRSPSRRSTYSTYHSRHSAPSIFNLGGSRYGRSSPSIFSSSSRRARPRAGFIHRIIHYIKRLLRDIYSYARRHPIKVFVLVIMPLLTSGVLPKLLAMIGLRLPKGISGSLGNVVNSAGAGHGDGAVGGGMKELMNIAKSFV